MAVLVAGLAVAPARLAGADGADQWRWGLCTAIATLGVLLLVGVTRARPGSPPNSMCRLGILCLGLSSITLSNLVEPEAWSIAPLILGLTWVFQASAGMLLDWRRGRRAA